MSSGRFNTLFFPHDQKPDHFRGLDGLRGIAVLFVLLSHASNLDIYFHEYLNFQRIGKVGVHLFFVLSAYLLDRQIALAFINNKSSITYWKNYALRRFLRIYPLFFIALLFFGAFTFFGFETEIDTLEDIPLHLLLVRGESVFWSILVEFKYYFISPLILWFCHRYLKWDSFKLTVLFITIIFATIAIQYYYYLPMTSTLKYFAIFIVGTMISIYEPLYKERFFDNTKPLIFNIGGWISIALIVISIPYYFRNLFGFEVNFLQFQYYVPYAIAWGCLLLAAKYGSGLLRKIFEWKALRFLGTISFSLYLFHMPILDRIDQSNIPSGLKIYLFFFSTIALSTISYLLVERPLSKIRIKTKKASQNLPSQPG